MPASHHASQCPRTGVDRTPGLFVERLRCKRPISGPSRTLTAVRVFGSMSGSADTNAPQDLTWCQLLCPLFLGNVRVFVQLAEPLCDHFFCKSSGEAARLGFSNPFSAGRLPGGRRQNLGGLTPRSESRDTRLLPFRLVDSHPWWHLPFSCDISMSFPTFKGERICVYGASPRNARTGEFSAP